MSDEAQREFSVQMARLEHVLGRVADDALDPDDHVNAAEQAAQSAADVGGAFDRLVRETGGTTA